MNIIQAVIFLLLILSIPLYAQKNGKSVDPISNSYIINNLEMESSSDPDNDSAESFAGEVIFDDTFNDSISKGVKSNVRTTINSDVIKGLQKKDNRWHLVEYKVKKNDNIWKIARKYGVTESIITSINSITAKGVIRENDLLFIPSRSGLQYKIKRGDTLSSIADRYNTDVEKIAEHNDIDGKKIIAGHSIFIPGAMEIKKSVHDPEYRKTTEKTLNNVAKKTDKTGIIEKQKASIAAETVKEKEKKLRLSWPLRGPITSGFGYRTHPFSGEKTFHCGLDIGAEIGSSVRASAEGIVIFSGWKGAYGNLVVVQHKNNYITVYAHNSKLLVEVDETVKKGQKIALSGKTGATTGAHLHFEIRKGIVPLNPARILK